MPDSTRPSRSASDYSITSEEFEAFRRLILREVGISLSTAKVALVSSRLARRLRALGLSTYGDYYQYLRRSDPDGRELREMINCITTNKTSFFREPHHFTFLRERVLPVMQRTTLARGRRLRIWSAGCSTGEEPYSIAMSLLEHFDNVSRWDIRILASDVDTAVLGRAIDGVYRLDDVHEVPEDMLRRYFLRGTGSHAGTVRVKSALRDLIAYRRVNLIGESWPIRTTFDVIFCRNVIIYFDRPTQRRLLERFAALLAPGGTLFLGHSENVHAITDRFDALGGTIYRLRDGAPSGASASPAVAGGKARNVAVGDVSTGHDAPMLRTVLGSCVAACLFDPVARVGGMNHFLLPDGVGDGPAARYGLSAMPTLVEALLGQGARRDRLIAKLFGAVDSVWTDHTFGSAPAQNAGFARRYLQSVGIPVVAERLGGRQPLEVRFDTGSGTAFVRALPPGMSPSSCCSERAGSSEETPREGAP